MQILFDQLPNRLAIIKRYAGPAMLLLLLLALAAPTTFAHGVLDDKVFIVQSSGMRC